jgi:tetratricopeptide (TPR) repeat protein
LKAAIFGIIIAGVIAAIVHNFLGTQLITLLVFVGSAYLFYHQFREEIRVSDILDGRHFACRSVVKLMLKEQEVAEMAHAFRHLLEAMKNWGGREIIELEPYKEPALRMIEPPQVDTTGGEVRRGLTPAWISGFGIITGIVGIGGYLYLTRVGVISKVTQEPNFTQSNLSTAKSSIPQKTPAIQQPDIWRENLQEADIMQVLSLSEDKLWQVKNRAAKSLPPKQGNRKIARAANDRGLSHLQGGRIADAINAFQEAYRANPADVEVVNNLGYAYLLYNDPVSAEEHMLKALTMRWDRSAAWGNLGQAYVKKGQMADAVASFSNAYRFSRDLNQTHTYFLDRMEKENDVYLKQALRQATQVGEKWYMKAEQVGEKGFKKK